MTLAQPDYQSHGPAPDGRIKPDVQGPTRVECASAPSNNALRVFEGTSCSTPHIGGVAALLRNWVISNSQGISVDPGQIYAYMILCGQKPFPFDNSSGAGPFTMPPLNGFTKWGKTEVSDGETVDIPLTLTGSTLNTLDGALWWPETGFKHIMT